MLFRLCYEPLFADAAYAATLLFAAMTIAMLFAAATPLFATFSVVDV